MEKEIKNKIRLRARRKIRVRKTLRGTSEKPRMSIVKTNKNVHVQLIDDLNHHTLLSISTLSKQFKGTETAKKNCASAKLLGLEIAKVAKEKNIEKAVVDRGASRYHGIIAAVADGAREGGLNI